MAVTLWARAVPYATALVPDDVVAAVSLATGPACGRVV